MRRDIFLVSLEDYFTEVDTDQVVCTTFQHGDKTVTPPVSTVPMVNCPQISWPKTGHVSLRGCLAGPYKLLQASKSVNIVLRGRY